MFIYLNLFSSMFIYHLLSASPISVTHQKSKTSAPFRRATSALIPAIFTPASQSPVESTTEPSLDSSFQPFFIGEIHGEPHDCNPQALPSEIIWMIWMRIFLQTMIIAIDEPWDLEEFRTICGYDPSHQIPPFYSTMTAGWFQRHDQQIWDEKQMHSVWQSWSR